MKLRVACVIVRSLSLVLSLAQLTFAQMPTQTASTLPRLVRFGGTVKDLSGNPLTGAVGITFALYSTKTDGTPLWLETQNVTADNNGHYTALLGATKPDGLPAELFTSEQARWVGVQVSGQAEQPRVLLVSAPYALKAGDAETIGGLPPSAFVLAAPVNGSSTSVNDEAMSSVSSTPSSVAPPASSDVTTTGGTVNTIPLFTTATNIQNSILTQTGTTVVNVGGKLILAATKPATKTAGANSRPLDLVASSFSSTGNAAVNQTFLWQAEPAANNTANPSGTLNLLYGLGATAPTETGLKLSNNGILTFAKGQTFPGTGTGDGTITGVIAGTDLTGGGTSGTVTLNLNKGATDARYAQLAAPNTFTSNQLVNGTVSAASAGIGLHGISAGASKQGVGHGNAGVWGDSGALAGSGHVGILGTADANSAGWFVNNGAHATVVATNSGSGDGVRASATGTTGIGVLGSSPNIGVYGASAVSSSKLGVGVSFIGVWGDTGGTSGGDYIGVLGSADDNPAGVFDNSSLCCGTLIAENDEGSGSGLVFATYGSTGDLGPQCQINDSGDLFCTGTTSDTVAVDGGARKVALYSMQSSENWFEDAGSGQLSNGAASIQLDPTFAQTVNAGVEYHVFLTPNGDCKGLYASRKSATSFEVHELGGGKSSIAFDFRIMAKRVGYEKLRFKDVTEQFSKQGTHRKMMRRAARPSAESQSGPKISTPPAMTVRAVVQPIVAQSR
jgi:hypothetical protein